MLEHWCGDKHRRFEIRQQGQIKIAGLDQTGAGGQFVDHGAVVVEADGGAAAAVETQGLIPVGGCQLVEAFDKALVDGLGFPVAFLGALNKGGQLAHVGVIAHETAEAKSVWVGLDQGDHCIELVRVGEAAPVQAHVDLEIDVQAPVQIGGQLQILLQPRAGIDQPLELPLRIEGATCFAVKLSGGLDRHGLAQQHVHAGLCVGQGIHERLMEHHDTVAAGFAHHGLDHRHTGQGFGHDTQRAAGR